MPDWIRTDSIRLEDWVPTSRAILDLLADRGLQYVEIPVKEIEPDVHAIAVGDGIWQVNAVTGEIARIELGKVGDRSCAHPATLPSDIRGRLVEPPFLPGSCIKLTFVDKATARTVLHIGSEAVEWRRRFGSWVVTNASDGRVLARLTSSENRGKNGFGPWINKLSENRVSDCRTPSAVLADRVRGESDARDTRFVWNERMLKRDDFSITAASRPVVQASAQFTHYTNSQRTLVFSPHAVPEGWISALNRAEGDGFAGYGPVLLDWKASTVVSTDLQYGTEKSPIPYSHVYAVGEGFLGYRPEFEGDRLVRVLLAHIRNNGNLDWEAYVLPPDGSGSQCFGRFDAGAAFVKDGNLHLADFCRPVDKASAQLSEDDYLSIAWTIPLKQLPGTL